jgi:hypothetical protein
MLSVQWEFIGMENETFPSTPWKEKLEYSEHNYNRQKNHQVLKKKLMN